jgi:16S rRNA (uracil1498-N3)-methyltransferase
MLLCNQLPRPGNSTLLSEQEAHHAIRVLRLKEGDIIDALDGAGHKASVILRAQKGKVRIEYLQTQNNFSQSIRKELSPLPIILEVAALKGEAMEWVIEKSVELGIKELIPLLTAHTVVQMNSKNPQEFQQRWQKIADQSLKQCGRLEQMRIHVPLSFQQFFALPQTPLGTRLWCDESSFGQTTDLLSWLQKNPYKESHFLRILIGPEGGWSADEKAFLKHQQRMNLGPLILRAETAALFAVSLASAFFRQSILALNVESHN